MRKRWNKNGNQREEKGGARERTQKIRVFILCFKIQMLEHTRASEQQYIMYIFIRARTLAFRYIFRVMPSRSLNSRTHPVDVLFIINQNQNSKISLDRLLPRPPLFRVKLNSLSLPLRSSFHFASLSLTHEFENSR